MFKLYFVLFCVVILTSCGNQNENDNSVSDSGLVNVKNGKEEIDSVAYECDGCSKNLEKDVFDELIEKTTEIAKNKLNNPLSFKPKKIKMTIIKEDSTYWFDDNKQIKNLLFAISEYEYTGQNAYGTELAGNSTISLNILDGKVVDLSGEIKLKPLSFEGNDKIINRTLFASNSDGDFIDFHPTFDKSIIVSSSISCVDEGTLIQFELENADKVELRSWNDFNCDGKSYFKWFDGNQINLLSKSKLKYIFVYSKGESVLVRVPKNQSDYFFQLFKL